VMLRTALISVLSFLSSDPVFVKCVCFDAFLLLHIIVDDIVMLLLYFVNRCSVAKSLLSLTFKVGTYRQFGQDAAQILSLYVTSLC